MMHEETRWQLEEAISKGQINRHHPGSQPWNAEQVIDLLSVHTLPHVVRAAVRHELETALGVELWPSPDYRGITRTRGGVTIRDGEDVVRGKGRDEIAAYLDGLRRLNDGF